eukprot:6185309-Pleurochrysis_carterae.AAC.3
MFNANKYTWILLATPHQRAMTGHRSKRISTAISIQNTLPRKPCIEECLGRGGWYNRLQRPC